MSNNDNRLRIFAEVVSIDAWHEDFSGRKNPAVDLFAQVSFSEGRIGAEEDSPITFRLRLRRAELVAFCGQEPIKITRSSILRSLPPPKAKKTEKHTTSRAQTAGLGLKASPVGLGISSRIGLAKKEQKQVILKSEIPLSDMAFQHRKDADGNDAWVISPTVSRTLEGGIFDDKVPLFEMKDTRKNRDKSLPPTMQLEIRCRREDLEIFDITLKNETLTQKAMAAAGSKHREKAAEAYIRTKLFELGLHVGDISGQFARFALAQALARPE